MTLYSDIRGRGNTVTIIQENAVGLELLQAYFESIGRWNFVKRITKADPEYIDDWDNNLGLDADSNLIKAIARALKTTPEELVADVQSFVEPEISFTLDQTLEQEKNNAKALVNAEREERKFLPVEYENNWYTVSEWDIIMIMSLLAKSKFNSELLPTDEYWRTAENINVHLSSRDLDNLD